MRITLNVHGRYLSEKLLLNLFVKMRDTCIIQRLIYSCIHTLRVIHPCKHTLRKFQRN